MEQVHKRFTTIGLTRQIDSYRILTVASAMVAAVLVRETVLERRMPLKRAFLDTPDGQIHYRIAGTGEPPLVLLHQTARSSDEYTEMMPILARNRRVIAMDSMGYGDSDKPPKWYSIEDYAKSVIMLLDTLNISRAVMVGHHTGSKIAIEVAATYPERVAKLVLLGPYSWKKETRQRVVSQKGLWQDMEVKEDGSHLMEIWRRDLEAKGASPELRNRVFLDRLKAGANSRSGSWASASYQQEERLPSIQCPTLIIWGTKDIDDHEQIGLYAHNIAEAISNCKVTKIQGGTGSLPNQMPDEVARLILDFIANQNS